VEPAARVQTALSRIRAKAKADGLDHLTKQQIDAVIAAARRERKLNSRGCASK
jgi:hypothetical protein